MPRRATQGASAPLTGAAATLLRKLARGASLTASRTFPHPHRFEAVRVKRKRDGNTETITSFIHARDVSLLVEMGLLVAVPKGAGGPDLNRDQRTDIIEYHVSERGREAAKNIKAFNRPPESQADIFDGAA